MDNKMIPACKDPEKRKLGPNTPEGKEHSKYNAVRHGLRAKTVVLPGEDGQAHQDLRARMFVDSCPVGEFEAMLLDEIVTCVWQLSRAHRIEEEHLARAIDLQLKSGESEKTAWASLMASEFRRNPTLPLFKRYETAIRNELLSLLHEFQRLQAARLTGKPTVPLAIDIDITGGVSNPPESGSADQPDWSVPAETAGSDAARLTEGPPYIPPNESVVVVARAPRHHDRTLATRLGASGTSKPDLGKGSSLGRRPGGWKLRDYLSEDEIRARSAPKSYAFTFMVKLAAAPRGDFERGRASRAAPPAEEQPHYLDSELTYGAWTAAKDAN